MTTTQTERRKPLSAVEEVRRYLIEDTVKRSLTRKQIYASMDMPEMFIFHALNELAREGKIAHDGFANYWTLEV